MNIVTEVFLFYCNKNRTLVLSTEPRDRESCFSYIYNGTQLMFSCHSVQWSKRTRKKKQGEVESENQSNEHIKKRRRRKKNTVRILTRFIVRIEEIGKKRKNLIDKCPYFHTSYDKIFFR